MRLLESLKMQRHKDFEVIIVDGGSSDKTPSLEADFASFFPVKYIRQRQGGFVAAVNEGMHVCSGEIYLRTDDDVVGSPDWLQAICESFSVSERVRVGGVTGPVSTPDEGLQNRDLFALQARFKTSNQLWRLIGWFYYDYLMEKKAFDISRDVRCGAFTFGANFPEATKLSGEIEVDHHESCNMAVRIDLLRKVGGFDNTFIETAEYCDSDVSYKIRKLGYKILFNPKALIYHYPSKQGFFSKRFYSYHRIENFIRFYFRHIRPNTLDKLIRFFAYICFLNTYFIYIFFTTGKIAALGSIPSSLINIPKYALITLFHKEGKNATHKIQK